MLDIRAIAEDPAGFATRLKSRGVDPAVVTDLASLYEQRKKAQADADALRSEKKKVSKEIGRLIKEGMTPDEAKAKVGAQTKEIDDKIKTLEESIEELDVRVNEHILGIPNVPHESVPVGADENDNTEVRRWGEPRKFDFEPKDHVTISEGLGNILDFERGAKIAGARFTLLTGPAAKMQRALIHFMLDIHTQEHGYTEVWPPFLVNRVTATGTGNLPKFEDDLFRIDDPELFLIPTAEVPVTNIHAREILDGEALPVKYVAYTPCFRREAGSYGKDVRGMIRQHQFEKVELVQFVKPEESMDALEALTGNAEVILQRLELPYRAVTLCTGDMGFSSTKTYDLEVWLPSQDKYREISSCSCFSDFQARRASIRFRREKGAKPELVHTLNGSGLAVGRTLVAILENHQQADGSVTVPAALRPYFGADSITP